MLYFNGRGMKEVPVHEDVGLGGFDEDVGSLTTSLTKIIVFHVN
jgi:hypothetical protein